MKKYNNVIALIILVWIIAILFNGINPRLWSTDVKFWTSVSTFIIIAIKLMVDFLDR